MSVAYVVVSSKNPEQVLRLVSVLREGPEAEVVVRHDQRRTALPRADVEERGGRLHEDGIEVGWGEYSYLRALLGALRATIERLDPSWIVVLSGQDYPLRPLVEIEARLGAAEEDAFLTSAWELPMDGRPEPPAEEFFLRYAYRHFAIPSWAPRVPGALRSVLYTREMPAGLGNRLGLRRVRPPFGAGRSCFVSSDWVTLSGRAARVVLDAAEWERALMRHYRRSVIPSESFFATALLNHPDLHVSRHDRRLISFADPGAPHPDVFTGADLQRLLDSGMDFARKFDAEVDSEVLDALDERRRSLSASS